MTNSLGYLMFALSMFINAWPAEAPERPIEKSSYRVAESFGCVEVARTCRARVKSAEIRKWTTKTHGLTNRN